MTDSTQRLTEEVRGSKCLVRHCDGAIATFRQCVQRVDPRKRAKQEAWLRAAIERMADGHRMSSDSLAPEASLPDKHTKFYALKKIPTRGYVWLSKRLPSTWFISHYVHKDYRKLRDVDTSRVHHNWRRIEIEGADR